MFTNAVFCFTAVLYGVAAIVCLTCQANGFALGRSASKRRIEGEPQSHARRWVGPLVAMLLVLAGLDRYFGWSHEASDWIRSLAYERGWYEQRRKFQSIVIACVLMMVLALVWGGRLAAKPKRTAFGLSLHGLAVLSFFAFFFIRMLSNHYVDRVFVMTVMGVRIHWLIEWALLGFVIASGLLARRDRYNR